MTRPSIPDAVVVGGGHNGLVAANVLADAGWSVRVLEAADEPGGAVRSGEPVEPGFVHDHCASFFPLGAASPVFRALDLDIPWRHGPLVLAHPALDGSCAVLERDGAGELWRSIEPAVLRGLVTPFPQVRTALTMALEPAAVSLLRLPKDELERRILVGNALHTDLSPTSLLGRAFGVALTMLGRRYGFPCVAGGAGTISRLLVERATERGVEIRCGEPVRRLPAARRAVLAAVDAWELGRLLGRPSTMRPDPAVVKVEWTLDGVVPWSSEPAHRSPVVHLGGPGRFTIFGQYSVADPTRAPAGKETAWAYSHDLPDADAIEAQVDELAPGFRELVRGRRDERMPPGTVNLGTMGRALVLRGRFGRPETGAPGVYLASASAHPGGGVHGAPGWIAAQAALRSDRSPFRRPRRADSFTISST